MTDTQGRISIDNEIDPVLDGFIENPCMLTATLNNLWNNYIANLVPSQLSEKSSDWIHQGSANTLQTEAGIYPSYLFFTVKKITPLEEQNGSGLGDQSVWEILITARFLHCLVLDKIFFWSWIYELK